MKYGKLLLIGIVALLLNSCSGPSVLDPLEVWLGAGQQGTRNYTVRLEYRRSGSDIIGTYKLSGDASNTGTINGTIEDGLIVAKVSPSSSCFFDLTGTVTDTQLRANLTPNACPGGSAGTWTLQRQN